jgi:superfamily II DNA or RNA helicase
LHPSIPAPGSLVWIRRRRWRVESARRDRSVVRLDVVDHVDREARLTFLAPFDRPALTTATARPRRARPSEAAARLAGLVARASTARGLSSALEASVDILPYQLEPALAVVDGARRLLIADEVGLGKTIQAALAIAELKRRRPVLRAMVVVPRSLRDQWRDELNERFALGASVADREGLDAAAGSVRRGHNPWTRAGVWIVSADYLKQPHVFDAVPAVPWDIVVIDEAHDACGQSARHEAADEIARRARHVLLLTATPHVGDAARFARLEGLGRLTGIDDPLTTFRRTRASLGQASTRRVRWSTVALTPIERAVLDTIAAFERAVMTAVSERQRDGAVLLLSIFRKRALSTMTALYVSLERRLGWILGSAEDLADWVQPRLELEDPDDRRADDDCAGLTVESGLAIGAERTWLRRLRALTGAAIRHESKVRRVVRLLQRTREPVLIFTEFRHSLEALTDAIERALSGRRRIAVLHGAQSPAERAAAISRFRGGDASVLLATDVASQGLNFQDRARWVVSLELPWTPARIEQRVGRVDRIGQTRSVHATLILAGHPAENGLLARFAKRTLDVRRVVGDDALAGIAPPSEGIIAHALLAGRCDIDERWPNAQHELTASVRWRRSARALARQLIVKRALNRRWRAPDDAGGRPCLTILRHRAPSEPGAVVVVSVPILDGTGFLVERRVVCLSLNGFRPDNITALARSDALREWLTERLAKRLSRLQRTARAVSAAGARVDQAIARHLVSTGWPVELQVGLFDRRDERPFVAAREEVAAIDRATLGNMRGWQAAGELDIGAASVELVFCWRSSLSVLSGPSGLSGQRR